jgi:uncharacterized membrane protein
VEPDNGNVVMGCGWAAVSIFFWSLVLLVLIVLIF